MAVQGVDITDDAVLELDRMSSLGPPDEVPVVRATVDRGHEGAVADDQLDRVSYRHRE